MRLSKCSSRVLRFLRLGAVLSGFLALDLCFHMIDSKSSIWLWLPLGILSLLVFLVAYLAYKELNQRPIAEQQFTQYQTQTAVTIFSFLVLLVCSYRAITTNDTTQRTALIIVNIPEPIINIPATIVKYSNESIGLIKNKIPTIAIRIPSNIQNICALFSI